MSSKKDRDRAKSEAPPPTPPPVAGIELPKGFRGLLKHLMYNLHVVRPVGSMGVDKFCYEWFANRIAEQKRASSSDDKSSAFNEDYLDDNIWKLEVAEPPLLSYGDDEDSDFDDDESNADVFDLKQLDPTHIVEDEAARKIQLTYRAFARRRKLRTRRLDAERARQKVKAQHERARKKNPGNKTDLHWTATETIIPGLENEVGLESIAAENDQRASEDRAERHRAAAGEQMQKNYDTRKMLDSVGADQEEADLAAAKIQAVYRKHQIEKTRAEISELQKTPSSEKVGDEEDSSKSKSKKSKKKKDEAESADSEQKPVKWKEKEREANAEKDKEDEQSKKSKKSKKKEGDESSGDQKEEKTKPRKSKKNGEETSSDETNTEKPKKERQKKTK